MPSCLHYWNIRTRPQHFLGLFCTTKATLLTLNLLAFLSHTVLALVDMTYQKIRLQRGTRKGFFQDVLSLTKYLLFEGWQALIKFMLADAPPKKRTNSS